MRKSMAESAKQILSLIKKSKVPLTQTEIKKRLKMGTKEIDRSTVYRNLASLLKEGLIVGVDFGDGKTRFEKPDHHHHHVVCKGCKKVFDVELPLVVEKALGVIEKKWKENEAFAEINHSLEFFGKCNKCSSIKANE